MIVYVNFTTFVTQEGQTVWTSFENLSGEKGAGALENKSAKGHAFDKIAAGDSCILLNIKEKMGLLY